MVNRGRLGSATPECLAPANKDTPAMTEHLVLALATSPGSGSAAFTTLLRESETSLWRESETSLWRDPRMPSFRLDRTAKPLEQGLSATPDADVMRVVFSDHRPRSRPCSASG